MEISNARYISLILSLLLSISFPDTFAQKTDTSKFYNDSLNALSLKHVTIVSDANIRRNNTYQFSVNEIKSLVSVVGEPDVLRYLGTLPGISQGMEGGLGYFVRGSNSGNNRVELDGVPVYGNTHLFGLFSIFPSEIVESVNFMSGKIPASSGNLLASVTQISTLSLDTGKIVGGLSLSPFIAGANIKGKLTDKIGFQVAGRYSLLNPVFRLLKSSFDMDGEVLPEVTDLYAKVHYRPIENHEIDISGYYSNDYLKYSGNADDNYNKIAINWGNKIFRLSWNYQLSSRYSLKALAYYNDFYSGQEQQNYTDEKLRSELRLQSRLKELSASVSLKYQKDNLGWELGYHANSRNIRPASEKMYIINNKTDELKDYTYNPDTHSSINAVYGELKYLYKLLEMNFGYRGNYYQSKNYSRWDNNIRASLTVTLPGASGIEISYDEFSQFHHIAEGLPAGWDLDLIMPSDNVFVPEKARQYYTGTYWAKGKYHFSAGVYCKSMDNLISYKNGANIFGVQNTNWQEEITSGSGTSRGLEVRAELFKRTDSVY
ncbi:hypothetical protein FACS189446_4760 [Bacteroidia bacterium]|nr:hypothetical protein FACS189446_4760 [Bacteroidia bacterium]